MIRKHIAQLVGGLALIALASCNSGSGYTLSGTVDQYTEGQNLYLAELNQNNNQTTIIDTLEVVDGKFEQTYPAKKQPTVSFLTLDGVRGNVLFIAEKDIAVHVELYTDSLYTSTVTGGAHNELLYDYLGKVLQSNRSFQDLRQEMMQAYSDEDTARLEELELRQQEIIDQDKETKVQLVENNPHSIVSILVLQDMINSKAFNSIDLQRYFEGLSEEVKGTHLAYTVGQTLEAMTELDAGSKAPEFSAPTPEGEELALKDALGKVTLVDFWASWCRPCRVENPNIVEVYRKYHDQGFNVLGVSLDRPGNRDEWLKAIEDDQLEWYQVSNLEFWQDPVARLYKIQAIPAAFLLDEDGVIITRDPRELRGDALAKTVAKALGLEE